MTHEEIDAWMRAASRSHRARVRSAWKAGEQSFRDHNPDATHAQYARAGRAAAEFEITLIAWGTKQRSKKNG